MAAATSSPLTILYFAWLRERVGTGQEKFALPAGITTVGELVGWLTEQSPRHSGAFENRQTIRCAVNQDFADASTPVRPGDEVAFFPPVTGG